MVTSGQPLKVHEFMSYDTNPIRFGFSLLFMPPGLHYLFNKRPCTLY